MNKTWAIQRLNKFPEINFSESDIEELIIDANAGICWAPHVGKLHHHPTISVHMKYKDGEINMYGCFV